MKRSTAILLLILISGVPFLPALDQSDGALGISLYNQGRLVEAKEVLERVVETGTAGSLELAVLGMTCIKLGELDRAAQILEEARRQGPFRGISNQPTSPSIWPGESNRTPSRPGPG